MIDAAKSIMQSPYEFAQYGNIRVAFRPHLDGGGRGFGQDFVPVVRNLFGHVGRVYEFCAGPGFIGFSLLANGLCDSLCLSDINREAVEAAKETVRRNHLQDRVAVFESDGLRQIPPSEKWDLVVSNPPHFKDQFEGSLRHCDRQWALHHDFYTGVKSHLNPGGSVLVQENYEGSEESDFDKMLAAGGLKRVAAFMYTNRSQRNYCDTYYFVWSRSPVDSTLVGFPHQSLFVCTTGEDEIIEVDIANCGAQTIYLRAFTRYRLLLVNRLKRKVNVLVYTVKFGLLPRFLRTFRCVDADESASCFCQFYPGQYVLQEQSTKTSLCNLRVQ